MCFKPLGCLAIPLAQGIAGASGNSVLNGTGVPSSSLGVNGDFYIDTNNSQIYGPKTAGSWGSPTSLLGLTGNGVLSGAGAPLVGLGENGDFYIDTTANAIYGPKTLGSWGSPTSLFGPTGVNGTTRLYELLTTQTSNLVGSWQTLALYTIPANTFVNDGDSLIIEAWVVQSGSINFGRPSRRITINGVSITGQVIPMVGTIEPTIALQSPNSVLTKIEIIKQSASTAIARVMYDIDITTPTNKKDVLLTGLTFTNTNLIDFSVFQVVASSVELRSFTIDKISS
jgi:hypothetical protein